MERALAHADVLVIEHGDEIAVRLLVDHAVQDADAHLAHDRFRMLQPSAQRIECGASRHLQMPLGRRPLIRGAEQPHPGVIVGR